MKFIAAFGAFIVALAFNTPFFGAVLLAVGAWFLVHFARQGAQEGQVARRGEDPLAAEIAQLRWRVHALENDVARLKGVSEPQPDVQAPQPPAPIEEAPALEPEPLREPPPVEPQPQPVPAPAEPEIVAQAPEEPRVQAPAGPTLLQRLVSGNIVAKVGAIILFFGVGFLLKFAYERNMVPPEARLLGVALAALGVAFAGWKLLEKRRLYAVILQGVASGLAYLDVFFALKTYGFIGVPVGFSLFAVIGVATTLLAVRLDAKPLALLGLTGAFMAPVLASSGGGNVAFLFSYYLLLNLFILGVSWWRAWRALNLTGWFFTFAVAVIWGWQNYRPELFTTVEPFLLAFFVIYLVVPILFAMRQPPELKGWVDGTLVFGTPAAVAVLQSRLVWNLPYGLAWSCAAGALLYGLLSVAVLRHQNMKLLGQTYIALAVGLGTLAVFYAFGTYTTFALWTLEGAAILWVCLRQKSLLGRLFGLLVQAAGAVLFFLDYDRYLRFNPYFNDAVVGCALIAVASFISAAVYRRHADAVGERERVLPVLVLVWGALVYGLGGLDVIHHAIGERALRVAAAVIFISASCAAFEFWGRKAEWTALRALGVAQPLLLAGAALYLMAAKSHPLAQLGWLAWPAGFISLFWQLHRQRLDGFQFALQARYVAAWAILAVLATWEAGWWMAEREYLYVMLLGLVGHAAAAVRYRLREHGTDAVRIGTLAMLWGMFFWFGGGLSWIRGLVDEEFLIRAALLFTAGTSLVYWLVSARFEWPAMRAAAQLPWVAIPLAVVIEFGDRTGTYHPFGGGGWALAWVVAVVAAAWTLRAEEARGRPFATGYRHAVMLYAPLALATWELGWWLVEFELGIAWRLPALAMPAALGLLALTKLRDSQRWPFQPHWPVYRDMLLLPCVIGLAAWMAVVNIRNPGSLAPLSMYVPLLNPIDVAVATSMWALAAWVMTLENGETRSKVVKAGAVVGLVWINAIALRTIHYWADVPYRFDALMHSVLVQATLSILWTSTAFALMLLARRRVERGLWIAGAALLALVVGKLFLIDLANTGTVARIVSFLGVGVLLLAIGYVAPVPPGQKEESR